MSYLRNINIAQNVVADATNSIITTSANITPTNYWEGGSTSTLGVAGIQVNVFGDTNYAVAVYQSMDNSHWDILDAYTYYCSAGGNSWTTQATASYVKVRATNIGTTTGQTLRVQTALCPVVEAVPRALSAEGNLKVGVYEMEGDLGVRAEITPNNEQRVTLPVRLVGATFPGSLLDQNFWIPGVAGTTAGVVSQASGILSLTASSGTATIGSTAAIQSVQTARYTAGSALVLQMVSKIPAATAGTNARRWGAFTSTVVAPTSASGDGFFFQYDAALGLSVVCRKDGSDANIVSTGAFNGKLGATFVPTLDAAYTWKIIWTTRKAWFIANDEVIHAFTGTNTPLSSTFSLPVRAECVNANGNASANVFNCRSGSIRRFGLPNTRPIWKWQHGANTAATILKRSPGTLQRLVVNAWADGATVILYDALSATNTIASLTFTAGNNAALTPFTIEYNLDFYTGLCFTVTGAMDVTIVYE